MACATEIQAGAIGTSLRVTIVDCNDVLIDISSASIKTITLKSPDGTTTIKAASFFTDGSDGILEYISVSGDLDIVGTNWQIQGQIQGQVTLVTGEWSSTIGSFSVLDNL